MALSQPLRRLAAGQLRAALRRESASSPAVRPVGWAKAGTTRRRFSTSSQAASAPASVTDAAAPTGKGAEECGKGAEEPGAEKEGHIPPEVMDLFDTLRGEAIRRLEEFGPIHLFSLCWAYSTAGLLDEDMRQRITKAALALGEKRDKTPAKHRDVVQRSSKEDIRRTGTEEPHIAHEGEHWMALYKPAHWQVSVDSKEAAKAAERSAAVAPFEDEEDEDADPSEDAEGDSRPSKLMLQSWVKQHLAPDYPICSDSIEAFGLLHRLDAQTSGFLVCAKSYVGAYWLRLQWCSYLVDKEYVCLVHGWVPRDIHEIHKRIRVDKKKAANSRRTVSTICSVGPSGKPSYTEVATLAHLVRPGSSSERYSLVALKLHTGRTHQIRVHMQSIGHPLVTDAKYAEDHLEEDRSWCPRNFLHTYHLGFDDVPRQEGDELIRGDPVDLICPLPSDLRAVLQTLRPVDQRSTAPFEAWTSGDSGKLCTFEDYVCRPVSVEDGEAAPNPLAGDAEP